MEYELKLRKLGPFEVNFKLYLDYLEIFYHQLLVEIKYTWIGIILDHQKSGNIAIVTNLGEAWEVLLVFKISN